MPLPAAGEDLPVVGYMVDALWSDLFEAPTGLLEPEPLPAGMSGGDVAPDEVACSVRCEHAAGVRDLATEVVGCRGV
jgi:hypothetical protein